MLRFVVSFLAPVSYFLYLLQFYGFYWQAHLSRWFIAVTIRGFFFEASVCYRLKSGLRVIGRLCDPSILRFRYLCVSIVHSSWIIASFAVPRAGGSWWTLYWWLLFYREEVIIHRFQPVIFAIHCSTDSLSRIGRAWDQVFLCLFRRGCLFSVASIYRWRLWGILPVFQVSFLSRPCLLRSWVICT